ncbi:hypothetical protein GYMLUDRAFT_63740 [Collybiopsis luxurians FD-317 M1]|uniref:Uncharacterized protein n=1 Tax=Collybiopsis luxurians FD-317 M1 TaxID=944289 RepID=A0A0D0CEE5_9AGAR|nr:hypothetical protein GYMLUDRAFT_63740 [Collybiopsis luxurians FD-317 M1]
MTTFKFDMLASITTIELPIFLEAIDELYNPKNQSGCENCIVWAFAQISSLYVWKQNREKEGKLSILELHQRANEIESYLASPRLSLVYSSEDNVPRLLTSEAFRTSAILYLRTVVHSDFWLVPDIAEAVNKAIGSLEQIASAPEKAGHAAVRSTVFPFAICTALTTKRVKQNRLLNTLYDGGELGTCQGIVELLKGLNLETKKAKAVSWCTAIQRSKMLLV